MLNNKALQVPYGTRDVLPGEAGARRIIENKLASTFKAWGYDCLLYTSPSPRDCS